MRFNKFRAKKTNCKQQHKHDSRLEAKHCDELHIRLQIGEITGLKVHPLYYFVIDGKQVKHRNGRRVGYTADFEYWENGKKIVADVKPSSIAAQSRDWPLRRAIFEALYTDVELREIK